MLGAGVPPPPPEGGVIPVDPLVEQISSETVTVTTVDED